MTAVPLIADEAPARARRLGPRSLTARLVIGVASLVLVVALIIGGGTYFALRYFLTGRLDAQLQSTAQRSQLQSLSDDQDHPYGPLRPPQDVWIVVLTPSGTVIGYAGDGSSDSAVKQLSLSSSQRTSVANESADHPFTITTTDGIQLRAETVFAPRVQTPAGSITSGIVVVGLSSSEERRTLEQLILLELAIGGGAVLVALAATLFGVRFSLRKLRRVTSTANEVAAELSPSGAGLDRRVDVVDDDTEVGQLAGSVNTLLSAVETQFAARLRTENRLRQFLADASHELRTPLTSIRGYAELARMQRAAGSDAEDNLSRIESEGTRMSKLVEDLLMLARDEQPDQQHPVRELVDVADLVEGAARDVRAANPGREVIADAVGGLQVVGDGDQLLRAVRNLVSNAAVHTAPDRPIFVRSGPDGDEVVIQVIDGGPGLPPEDAAHVFERFWRADKARTRARGGTGLGMSIVAAIVANHGGAVRFDSTVETGSTVTIRLPAVQY